MDETKYLPVFVTPQAEAETMAVYRSILEQWPVAYTELMIPTCCGDTHVIASGPVDAPPVILLHAFFASAVAWRPTAGALSRGFRVYAVDVIGEANPSRPAKVIRTMDEQLDWFKDLLDGLGVEKADLVGNSFGGFLCAYYALHLPERVGKIALIAPAETFHSILPFYLHCFLPKFLHMFFPKVGLFARWSVDSATWMRNGAPSDAQWEELFRLFMLHGGSTRYMFPRVFKGEELRRIQAPTLLLIGDKEVIYDPKVAIRAAQRYLPDLRAEILPNANHIAALSQPELVNEKILEFLGK